MGQITVIFEVIQTPDIPALTENWPKTHISARSLIYGKIVGL
jgi:hypothetical protein